MTTIKRLHSTYVVSTSLQTKNRGNSNPRFGRPKDLLITSAKLCLTVQAILENALADDMAILENEQKNTTTVSENEPCTSDTSRLLKRPAPKEIPEVDPLPSKINKQLRVTKPKLKNSPASDKDFLEAVKNNYLIKDGMCKTHTRIKNYIYIN